MARTLASARAPRPRSLRSRAAVLAASGLVASLAAFTPSAHASTAGAVGAAGAAGGGTWEAYSDGAVVDLGGAPALGSLAGLPLRAPVVGITATPDQRGYWLVAEDGGVFAFGDAAFLGSTGGLRLNAPVVGMGATPDGGGYWLVASDGGVFAFGDATFHGSTGAMHLVSPVAAIASTPDGQGYWLVAHDGGVFSFGDAAFHGSTGGVHLNAPIVGMAATPDGQGYWLAGQDGGVFTFGDAGFGGSGSGSGEDYVAVDAVSGGYQLVASNGDVRTYPGRVGGDHHTSPPEPAPTTTVPAPTTTVPAPTTTVPGPTTTVPGPTTTVPAPTTTVPAIAPAPSLPGTPVHLAWDDEFSGSSLGSAWNTCWWYSPSPSGCSNGTGESEWYTPANVTVGGGALQLTARRQTVQGVNMSTGAPRTYNYTSGMVDTRGGFSFTYGYVEWRASVPAGQGLWPALWMMPADDSWPPEIDALETIGSQPNQANFTYHPPSPSPQDGFYSTIPGLSSGDHTFGVDWEPGRITWYVDGTAYATTTDQVTAKAMYLVMDLAVGGSWPGQPDATTPFPATMSIDYVRVFQH